MNTNLLDFTGKRILVTGAASGIGKATALLLSRLGASLILADINNDGLKELRPNIRETDKLLQVDLSNTAQLISSVESAVKEVGPIDGMALVAGMLYAVPLKFVKEETWEKIEKVNLYSTIELAKLFTKKGVRPAGVGGGNYYSVLLLRAGWNCSECMLFRNQGRSYWSNQGISN